MECCFQKWKSKLPQPCSKKTSRIKRSSFDMFCQTSTNRLHIRNTPLEIARPAFRPFFNFCQTHGSSGGARRRVGNACGVSSSRTPWRAMPRTDCDNCTSLLSYLRALHWSMFSCSIAHPRISACVCFRAIL